MTKASDNPYPSILVTEGTVPATPASGKQRLYIDSTTHVLKYVNSSGTASNVSTGGGVATDTIWDAAGDLAVGTGADTAAKLTLGASGKVLASNGSTAVYAFPPGYELDYVQITSNVNVTATTEGTANTVITSSSVTFDGAPVLLEFFSPGFKAANVATNDIAILLRDDTGAAVLGLIAYHVSQAANDNYVPVMASRRFTPAAGARVYSIRAQVSGGTGVILAGAGGTGSVFLPAFLRITKV